MVQVTVAECVTPFFAKCSVSCMVVRAEFCQKDEVFLYVVHVSVGQKVCTKCFIGIGKGDEKCVMGSSYVQRILI